MSLEASTLFVRAAAAVLLVCGLAVVASAQNAPASAPPTPTTAAPQTSRQNATTDKPSPEEADLSITARVTAAEVLFRKVPNPKVEFTGRPERRTLWESERENLPEEVQPGVTYRDIGITLRIVSVFADIDRIVAEALGEIPPSDAAAPPVNDAPPANQTPPNDTATPTPPAARAPSDNPRRAARRANDSSNRRARTARTQP
ncbi:MAG TPA: hypothetical protein VFX96_12340 [Pyrinomonadaceae bacterium]|nr:hypothetical protein [Pyrinomonadaceae bacterium]